MAMLQRNLIVKCKMNIIDCPYRDRKTRDPPCPNTSTCW